METGGVKCHLFDLRFVYSPAWRKLKDLLNVNALPDVVRAARIRCGLARARQPERACVRACVRTAVSPLQPLGEVGRCWLRAVASVGRNCGSGNAAAGGVLLTFSLSRTREAERRSAAPMFPAVNR